MTSFPRIKAKNLSDFKWYGNNFTDLHEIQNCELPALETLDFSQCDLSKNGLPKLNMPGLETLRVNHCSLSNVSGLSTSNLPALRSLFLESNELTYLPPINFPQLNELSLDNNKISDVSFLEKSRL